MFLLDATLREGAQSPASRLTWKRRLAILAGLAAVGIEEAEIGWTAPGDDLGELVRAARDLAPGLRLSVWSRALPVDAARAAGTACDVVHISLPASDLHLQQRLGRDRSWALAQIPLAATAAREAGASAVALGLEDATRADPAFVGELCVAAREAGCCRVRVADTVSHADPSTMTTLVQLAMAAFHGPVGVHCHDDFGCATGNAVAALAAGATWADGCLLGGGERAGTARLEALAAWLATRRGATYDLRPLPTLCRLAARALGRRWSPFTPIVGEAIWTVESGLHVHGLAKDRRTYEPFAPETVGRWHDLRSGPRNGRAARAMVGR